MTSVLLCILLNSTSQTYGQPLRTVSRRWPRIWHLGHQFRAPGRTVSGGPARVLVVGGSYIRRAELCVGEEGAATRAAMRKVRGDLVDDADPHPCDWLRRCSPSRRRTLWPTSGGIRDGQPTTCRATGPGSPVSAG